MIALDSTALIDLYKSDESLINLLENLEDSILTTLVNYQEIMVGLNPKDKGYDEEKTFYDSIFTNMDVLPLSKKNIDKGAKLYGNLIEKEKSIGINNCMISSILIEKGIKK